MLFVPCNAVLYNHSISINSNESEYVYYEVPHKILNLLDDKSLQYELIAELGKTTFFMPKERNLFSVGHSASLKLNDEIEELKKKINRSNIIEFLDNAEKSKKIDLCNKQNTDDEKHQKYSEHSLQENKIDSPLKIRLNKL